VSWYDNAARDPAIGPIVPHGKTVARAPGYSLLELARAGLTEADAERLGIPVESGRNSMVGANVMQLMLRARG
jgi:ribosomal protein L13E